MLPSPPRTGRARQVLGNSSHSVLRCSRPTSRRLRTLHEPKRKSKSWLPSRVIAPSAMRRGARRRALEQQLPLAHIAGERRRALVLRPRLLGPTQLGQEIGPHARQEVIAPERRLIEERVRDREPGGRAV